MEIKQEFIKHVLKESGKDLNDAQLNAIGKYIHFKYGRSGRLQTERKVSITGNTLTLTHPIHQRFLDIRSKMRDGNKRKEKFPIHNRPSFSQYNKIAYKILFGFTKEVAEEMQKNLNNHHHG